MNKLVFLLLILLLPLACAQPFMIQTSNDQTGLTINYPKNEFIKTGITYRPHWHVHNATDGILRTNATVSCIYHLYNQNGSHIVEQKALFDSNKIDFYIEVSAENFTKPAEFIELIYCNSSILGGFTSRNFYTNPIGAEFTTPLAITYGIMLLLVLIVFSVSTYGFMTIQSPNIRNEDGRVVQINWKKYLKWFLFGIAYVSLVAISYFAWNISYVYLYFDSLANFFKMIFRILMILTIPVFVVTGIVMLVNYLQDKKWDEMLARGLHPR